MRIALTSLALFAVLAAAPAFADDMSDATFMRANQCLAHMTAQEPQSLATAAFEDEIHRQARSREPFLVQEAREDARAIARQYRRASTDGARMILAERADRACAGFETLIAGLPGQG